MRNSTAAELLHVLVRRKDLVMKSDKPKDGQTEEEFRALEEKVQRNMDWFLWYCKKLLWQKPEKTTGVAPSATMARFLPMPPWTTPPTSTLPTARRQWSC